MSKITSQDAGKLALEFLMQDLEIPEEDQEFFAVISSRRLGVEWYIVELWVEGLPDKWAIQVYDNGECDPCYTFLSPVSPDEQDPDLENFPESIANRIAHERRSNRVGSIV